MLIKPSYMLIKPSWCDHDSPSSTKLMIMTMGTISQPHEPHRDNGNSSSHNTKNRAVCLQTCHTQTQPSSQL